MIFLCVYCVCLDARLGRERRRNGKEKGNKDPVVEVEVFRRRVFRTPLLFLKKSKFSLSLSLSLNYHSLSVLLLLLFKRAMGELCARP